MKKILHLCADTGSDSYVFSMHGFEVIKVGVDIGVQNFSCKEEIYGVFANPPCTEFSTARPSGLARDPNKGMYLVDHCLRIIEECNPLFWVLENPARGVLRHYLGTPDYKYEPWWYGSPWTKQTSLWGSFCIPPRKYYNWKDVTKNTELYLRPGRPKPSLAFNHKSAVHKIPEFEPFIKSVTNDMSFRSLCSQKFAKAFFLENKDFKDLWED